MRLDNLPLWYLVACLFEPVRDGLNAAVVCTATNGDDPLGVSNNETQSDHFEADDPSSAPESGQPAGGREPPAADEEGDGETTGPRRAPPPERSGEDF